MADIVVTPISFWRRFGHALIDVAVFYLVWIVVLEITKVRFPFGFMQNFSRQDYDAYIKIMSWMTLSLFVLSIVLHAVFGGSIGKLVMGHRTVLADGRRASLRPLAIRSLVFFLLGLAILAPGPLVAFIFRAGSEPASLIVMVIGVAVWLFTTAPADNGRSLIERSLGLVTIRVRDLAP